MPRLAPVLSLSLILLVLSAPGTSAERAPAASSAARERSKEANALGLRAHKKKDHLTARRYFELALELDSENGAAHYNLACVLAVVYARSPCDGGVVDTDAIFEHLERAVALDPSRRARAAGDPDLDAVTGTYRFLVGVMKWPLASDADIRRVVPAIGWSGSCWGEAEERACNAIQFGRDGTVEWGGPALPGASFGRWIVKDRKIRIEYPSDRSWIDEVMRNKEWRRARFRHAALKSYRGGWGTVELELREGTLERDGDAIFFDHDPDLCST